MSETWTRRRLLIGTGTAVAATGSSIALLTDNASATVDGEFTVPDAETVLADATLEDIRLEADATWSFESNAKIHGIELELHAGATLDTVDMLARHEQTDIATDQLSGEATLSGSLINASDFDLSDFEPTDGELSTGVVAELRLFVLRNGEVAQKATQTEAFQVTVKKEPLEVSTSLGGTGEVVFEQSTATPGDG